MPNDQYEEKRILIWGKTYPELSERYVETVCTAGVFDDGSPVRIYPIDYRYLDGPHHFKKYQYITARVRKSTQDQRPESYKIDSRSIQCHEVIPSSNDEWGKRAEVVFRDPHWQFESVDDLQAAEKAHKASLGAVEPREIVEVQLHQRPDGDAQTFADKMISIKERLEIDRSQLVLFEEHLPPEMKPLEFITSRVRINWLCKNPSCKSHKMQILDWEVLELQRREGNDAALQKVKEICDLDRYALKFFLGNLAQHPASFTIVGLWYPKRRDDLLFR